MNFDWKIVIFFLLALVVADKLITCANIIAVKKNFPHIDEYSIEKNPLAKYFFEKFGLWGGTIIYTILSLLTVLVTMTLIAFSLKLFGVSNYKSIALYIITMIYGLVIANNLFFLLKFSRVVP